MSCVIALLSCGSPFADSQATIEKKERDPCERNVIVFTSTADPAKETKHGVSLGSTYTLFEFEARCVPKWIGDKYLENMRSECDFFSNQNGLLEDMRNVPALRNVLVTLVYSVDTTVRRHVFKLYLKGFLFSVFAEGKVRRVVHRPGVFEREVSEAAIDFVTGRHGSMIESETYATRWNVVCGIIKRQDNDLDSYKIWYNDKEGRAFCSLQSTLPWRRIITFDRARANVGWVFRRYQFMTVGNVPRGERDEFVCTIESPDGTIATQRLDLRTDAAGPRPTPRFPSTTPVEENWGGSATSEFASDMNWVTDSDRVTVAYDSEGARSVGGSSTTAAAVVVIVLVVVLGSAGGLFVFRDRIRRVGNGFLKVSGPER